MKEGYKKTELGWIPEEWKIRELKDVAFINPDSLQNKDSNYMIEYIDIESVKKGKVLATKKITIAEASSRAKRVVEKDDVIVSNVRPNLKSVAKICCNKENLICSTGFSVLRKRDINCNYLFQYVLSDIFTKQLVDKTVGSNYPAINSSDIKKTLVIWPSKEEQQKIAEILSTVDSQIDYTDELIDKTKELKKGLMQRLFIKGMGHSKFKKTEVGEIPVEWNTKLISEIAETTSGGTPSRGNKEFYENGTINWVKTGELNNKYIFNSEELITELAIENSSVKKIPTNSIILAMYGATIGKVSINKRVVTTNQACCSIICKDFIYYEFLYYYLLSIRKKLIELGAGGAQPNISQQIIRKICIPVPEKQEQKQIADILSSVDIQIDEYEGQKVKLEKLKKGLMQKLLTGKIRVDI